MNDTKPTSDIMERCQQIVDQHLQDTIPKSINDTQIQYKTVVCRGFLTQSVRIYLKTSTDGLPFGWISINGYEPDNNRPDPTIQLCPTCAVYAYRQLTSDTVLSQLLDSMKDENCIFYSNTQEHLQALKSNNTISQKVTATPEHEDADSMWLRKYEEN